NDLIEQNHANTDLVFCLGDFNFVEDPIKDRSSITGGRHEPGSEQFVTTRNLLGIKDIYREQNLKGADFTHYSKQYKTQSRIDRIYGNPPLIDCLLESDFHTVSYSDHKIVFGSFMLDPLIEPRGPSYWKLNVSILNSEEVRGEIRGLITHSLLSGKSGIAFLDGWEYLKMSMKSVLVFFSRRRARKKRVLNDKLKKTIGYY
ncbi:MAG: hypothetical protein GY853_01210, partial [PVC group bacterium]|nr:hypothetical protein [PVC group bacterium]